MILGVKAMEQEQNGVMGNQDGATIRVLQVRIAGSMVIIQLVPEVQDVIGMMIRGDLHTVKLIGAEEPHLWIRAGVNRHKQLVRAPQDVIGEIMEAGAGHVNLHALVHIQKQDVQISLDAFGNHKVDGVKSNNRRHVIMLQIQIIKQTAPRVLDVDGIMLDGVIQKTADFQQVQ
jgi:hypothetical protein